LRFQRAQPVNAGEGIGGALRLTAGDDLAHRREDLFGVRVEEVTDGLVAFRHPGATVEQAGGFQKRCQIDFHRCAAE
jgi:hypothetical protein